MGGFGLEVEDFGLAQGGQQAIAKSAKYIAGGLENLLRNVQLQVGQGRVPSFTPALRLHSAACAMFNAYMNKARFKHVLFIKECQHKHLRLYCPSTRKDALRVLVLGLCLGAKLAAGGPFLLPGTVRSGATAAGGRAEPGSVTQL